MASSALEKTISVRYTMTQRRVICRRGVAGRFHTRGSLASPLGGLSHAGAVSLPHGAQAQVNSRDECNTIIPIAGVSS